MTIQSIKFAVAASVGSLCITEKPDDVRKALKELADSETFWNEMNRAKFVPGQVYDKVKETFYKTFGNDAR